MEDAKLLGPDCIEGTKDDFNPQCPDSPAGWFYFDSLCQCVAPSVCSELVGLCKEDEIIDPISKCKCITKEESLKLISDAQALGPDCIVGTFDDDADNVG